MGLTNRYLQQTKHLLTKTEIPHYFEVKRGHEWKRCCGTLKDVERLLRIYSDASVTQVFPPQSQLKEIDLL